MIKKFFAFFACVSLMFGMISCNKDEIDDLNDDIKVLQDSMVSVNLQYSLLMDSFLDMQLSLRDSGKVDLKAVKMEQIGFLFESTARQPEAGITMLEATKVIYSDISELLPISDENVAERGEARGIAFGKLFASVARQPEASSLLDSMAGIFLGEYNSEYISDELLDYTKCFSIGELLDGMARQPEADSIFSHLSEKYLNYKFPVEE